METLPKLIKANDPTVLVNGRPIPVDYRMVWEENYQELKKAFDMHIVGVSLPVDDILGLDQPYPLIDILTKLVEASDILMHEKNYDRHGWEIITEVTKLAKEKIELLKAY